MAFRSKTAMKLFKKRKRESGDTGSANQDESGKKAKTKVGYAKVGAFSLGDHADDLLNGALDTLSHVLRVFANHSFSLDDDDHPRFVELCLGWARHVATGVPPEAPEPEESEDDSEQIDRRGDERQFKELRHFYMQRRRDERRYVDARLTSLRKLIWELLTGLKSLAGSGRSAEGRISSSLTALERAASSDSVSELRGAVTQAIGEIKMTLEEQRKTLEDELTAMGKKLAGMREELLEAKKQLEIDSLTKVYNRGAFDAGAARYATLAVLSGQPMTLLMVDLDHFKRVNDNYGHPVGDKVLVQAANTIVRTFPRKNDFVARYGGEEFAVILFDVDRLQAAKLCERLLEKVRQIRIEDVPELKLSCSIGFAQLEPAESVGQLVERADAALYQAKEGGRDRAVQGAAAVSLNGRGL
jgi:diguanylate cyclase